jgi:hypothetical protein
MLYKVITILRMSNLSLLDIPTELKGYNSYDTYNELSLLMLLSTPIYI